MPQFTPNPEAEASASFDVVAPGAYQMRIEGSDNMDAVTPFTSKAGNECIKVRLVFADPSAATKINGSPATNPGSVIDAGLVISPADKQGKLRSLCEAAGLDWNMMNDTDDLIGRELTVKLKVEQYNGEDKNGVARYVVPAGSNV